MKLKELLNDLFTNNGLDNLTLDYNLLKGIELFLIKTDELKEVETLEFLSFPNPENSLKEIVETKCYLLDEDFIFPKNCYIRSIFKLSDDRLVIDGIFSDEKLDLNLNFHSQSRFQTVYLENEVDKSFTLKKIFLPNEVKDSYNKECSGLPKEEIVKKFLNENKDKLVEVKPNIYNFYGSNDN